MQPVPLKLSVTIDPESVMHMVSEILDNFDNLNSHDSNLLHSLLEAVEQQHDNKLLVDSRQVAKMLDVSPRKLWQMQDSGEMPAAVKIGRLVKWNSEELKGWVTAGCPPRDEWEKLPEQTRLTNPNPDHTCK